jgi:1-deoxy-D-xylulose-5-phosphate synthase
VYSSFLQRAYDQIIHDVAIQRLPVIFAIDHAGAVSGDGETHQGIFDIAYLSHVPNMTILAPSSGPQLQEMLAFALSHNAPVAIRYPKDFAPLEENPLQNTKKIAIVSVGSMLQTAREAAAFFPEGEAPSVYDARFIKPINPALLSDLAAYDFVFSLEDGIRAGGFGESIRADYAFAFPDIFPQPATRQELFTRYGLDAASIYKKILEVTANGKQKNP